MKRIGCWLLAAVTLLFLALPSVPVVYAEETFMGNFDGMSENIYNPGDVRVWSFTPAASGEYILDSNNGLSVVLDGQSPVTSEGISSYYKVYRLSGGTTYTVRATWPASESDRNQAAFCIIQKQPLQSFSFSTTQLTLGKGNTNSLAVEYAPYYYSASAIQWTSSDSSIVSVEGSKGIQGIIKGMNFGTATVTASLGDRQTSCSIEVVKPTGEWDSYPLWTGTQNSVSGTKQFRCEPTASGWYVAYFSSGSGQFEMMQTNWVTDLPKKNAHLYNGQYELYYLQAGETYVATVIADGTATAVLQPAQSAKSITLYGPNRTDGSKIVGAVGGQMPLYAETDPLYAYALQDDYFVFTSSNTAVARLESSGNKDDPSREVVLVGPGTCTITVTVGDVSAKCQVTVAGQYEFKTGQTTTLKLSGEAYGVTGVFIPEKSGNYRFTMTGTGGTASIEGTNIGTYVNGSGTMSGWLEGGKAYVVNLSFGGSDHTVKVEYLDGTSPEENAKGDGDTAQTSSSTATAPSLVVEVEQQKQEQTVSRDQVEQLVETGSTLEVRGENVVVQLDSVALAAAMGLGDGDVTLSMQTLDLDTLNQAQKAAVEGSVFVKAVEISLYCGQVDIHDLGGGKATVQLPFEPEKGRSGSDYQVYWLSEDGQLEKMDTEYRDGVLCFTTDHFSTFVILGTKTENNWLVPVLCVLAVLLIAGGVAAYFLLRKKRKTDRNGD